MPLPSFAQQAQCARRCESGHGPKASRLLRKRTFLQRLRAELYCGVLAANNRCMTGFDWQAMKQEWIEAVQRDLLPKLLGNGRFKNGKNLVCRFSHEVDTWKQTDRFKPVIEIGNELSAAECLLDTLSDGDFLVYEPPMAGTKKRIDFLKLSAAGQRDWVEVKTVAPQWVDDDEGWQRFTTIAQGFPENAQLVVAQEWAGAAISGQSIKARWSFIQQAAAVEERATFIPEGEKGPVWLLLCSTGTAWYPDELEDFADFYRTGRPRADDWMRNAAERYMQERGINYSRSLAGFHYLGRKHDEISAHDFRMNVAGPSLSV
jgi:hypothetical protein